jgi:fructose-1,6-bisphosphatase/inositol monophosphatase family enzyme
MDLQERGGLMHAVVYDPNRNDLFTATKGHGAFLNLTHVLQSFLQQLLQWTF